VKISYDKEKVYESEIKDKTYMTVDAPVQQGDVLGKATFLLEGKELATVDLVADRSAEVETLLEIKMKLASFLGIDGDFWGSPAGTIVRILLAIVWIWALIAIGYWLYRKIYAWYKARNVNKL
jgi:hypothetical protein